VKLVHLVGFITKKIVTMPGYTNVKKVFEAFDNLCSGTLFGALFFISSSQSDFVYDHRLL